MGKDLAVNYTKHSNVFIYFKMYCSVLCHLVFVKHHKIQSPYVVQYCFTGVLKGFFSRIQLTLVFCSTTNVLFYAFWMGSECSAVFRHGSVNYVFSFQLDVKLIFIEAMPN